MICPSCDKEVTAGYLTGLTELLAMRIHLARDHGVFKTTNEVADLRVENDHEGFVTSDKELITIDIDKEERWLEPRPHSVKDRQGNTYNMRA